MQKLSVLLVLFFYAAINIHAQEPVKKDSLKISQIDFGFHYSLPYFPRMEGNNIIRNKGTFGSGGGILFNIPINNHWAVSTGLGSMTGSNSFSTPVYKTDHSGTVLSRDTLLFRTETSMIHLPVSIQYRTDRINNFRYFLKLGTAFTLRELSVKFSEVNYNYFHPPTDPGISIVYLPVLFEFGTQYYLSKKTSVLLSLATEKAFIKYHEAQEMYPFYSNTLFNIVTSTYLPTLKLGIIFSVEEKPVFNKETNQNNYRNHAYFEFGGNAFLGSFNYERTIWTTNRFALHARVGVLPINPILIPVSLIGLYGKGKSKLLLGTGIVPIYTLTESSSRSTKILYNPFILGYHFQTNKNFFRITYTPIIGSYSDYEFDSWGGISIGRNF